jgi:hypothetical protein
LCSGAQVKLLRVLSDERLDEPVVREAGFHRTRLYPTRVTLGLFVEQVLSADAACQDVVGRHLSQPTALGLAESSLNTGLLSKNMIASGPMPKANGFVISTVARSSDPGT